jgi:exosome complex RNA-binding protein Rrp42 (RNase PH superfamily)
MSTGFEGEPRAVELSPGVYAYLQPRGEWFVNNAGFLVGRREVVVDPCLDEERVMDARLTITTIEDGSICSMQKGGRGYFTREELEQAYDLASAKAVELREKLR